MKILILALFPSLVFGITTTYRKLYCEAFLMGALQDRTTFYLYPGANISTRLSLNRGEDEIFVTIKHNLISDSNIAIKDFHFGTKSSELKIRVAKDFKMKDLETGYLEIRTPTKNSSKTATLRCIIQK